MIRRRCQKCGTAIQRARAEDGELLLLDSSESSVGVRRWMVIDYGDDETPALVAPLDPNSPEQGHQEHAISCPLP